MREDAMDATDRERARAGRDELVARIARAVPVDGAVEPLPGVVLRRAAAPTELGRGVSSPSFCVIAQGAKEVLLGDHR
jgi:AraC-type transcriptional regulator N-terminus